MIDPRAVVLSSFSLRDATLEERFAAAKEAGFRAVGLTPAAFLEAEQSGMSAYDMKRLAFIYGVSVTEIEAVQPWWSGPEDHPDAQAAELVAFRMADTFSCRYMQVIGPRLRELDQDAASFAGLCDRAAQHGLSVGIEFLPWTNIADAAAAACIVDMAGKANGGVSVDVWHHFRGAADSDMIRSLTAKRIVGVQISDGTRLPENPDYRVDCQENRRVPGEGEFDLVGFLRMLDIMAVTVPVSLKVLSSELQALPYGQAATRIRRGFQQILSVIG